MCFQLPPTEVQSHLLPTFSRGALHGSIPDVFDGIFRKQPHQNQGGHMGTHRILIGTFFCFCCCWLLSMTTMCKKTSLYIG